MKLHRFIDVEQFCQQAQSFLLRYEAEHNLLLGILHTLQHYPHRYPEPSYLAIVESNGEILSVAVRTPPHKLLLSKALDLKALTLIAQDRQNLSDSTPGVSGLVTEVEVFLPQWHMLTGQSYRCIMTMRIHELTQVQPIAPVPGHLRPATVADRPLLLQWFSAFASEVGEIIDIGAEPAIDAGLERQSIYLWEDNEPVSWASGRQSLPTAARIGPVYTPLNHRRQGYASACVAALSQKLLNEGCDRCFLLADLANPTSNHIYQQIGYRPITDWREYSFTSK